MVKIIFFDYNKPLIETYQKVLYGTRFISGFVNADVENLLTKYQIDAIVSPANSFGDMKGGIDKAYTKIFNNIEKKAIDAISSNKIAECGFGYYLPIGKNVLVQTDHKSCNYLIVAPTMFTPRNIVGTMNIYLTFYGILEKYYHKDVVIACPGLGTGIGSVSAEASAKQIMQAINDFLSNNPT